MDELSSIIEVGAMPDSAYAPRDLREALGPISIGMDFSDHVRRAQYVLGLSLPSLMEQQDKFSGSAMIVGGGTSISLDDIRDGINKGVKVCAVNCAHDWLISNDIVPDFAVMLDPAKRIAAYMTPHADVKYLFGTTLHPSVWNLFRAARINPFVFVPLIGTVDDDIFAQRWPDAQMVVLAGVTTVGLRAANVLAFLGFTEIHFHGFDSCYSPGAHGDKGLYRYKKPVIQHDRRTATIKSGRTQDKFTCVSNGAMARQWYGLYSILDALPTMTVNGREGGIRYRFAGDGALPWMAWKDGGPEYCIDHLYPERMKAKYGSISHFDYEKGKPYGI